LKQVRKTSLFILILIISACSNNPELEDEELAKLYVELMVVDDMYRDSDSLKLKRIETFQKYSTTKEFYDSTFIQFTHERERWENFFNLTSIYLDSLKAELKAGKLKKLP